MAIVTDDFCFVPADLLHIFSYLPRDLNFLEHSSNIGWKEWVIVSELEAYNLCLRSKSIQLD